MEVWEYSFQNMSPNTRLLIHFVKEIPGLIYCGHKKQTLDPSTIQARQNKIRIGGLKRGAREASKSRGLGACPREDFYHAL